LMLSEMAKAVDFELGFHIINGEFASTGDDKLFNGIIKRISDDADTIRIATPKAITEENVIAVLKNIYTKTPKRIRQHPSFKLLMSADKYDEALSNLPNKGTAYTDTNVKRFKGIVIESLVDMPEHVIIGTIASNDMNSNLWLGVHSLDDTTTVKVGLLSNAGENYFFKMKMKVDTQIAWGDQTIFYDGRAGAVSIGNI
ncbi:MAG: hypothetical protein RR550_04580, partial [Rikenellaceae bacterium]